MCNRKETTWWEPSGQIKTECWESESSEEHVANQGVSDVADGTACKGVQALAPLGSWKKIWEEVPSLSICLSIYLSNNKELLVPFENKMREIFL